MIELILSAPTMTTFLYCPLSTNLAPVVRAKMNPEQAALRSYPHEFTAPTLWAMRLAVEGKCMSAVTVATIMRSISAASIPRFSHNVLTASAPISDVALVGSFRIRRSSIPVRVRIHSSLVSTIFSKSALERTSSGK